MGIPAVTIGCPGFPFMMRKIGASAGYPDLRTVEYPVPIALDSKEQIRQRLETVVVPNIIKALTTPVKSSVKPSRRGPGDRDVVFEGSFDEVQSYFLDNKWGDGLPIVPPTVERVEEFLKFTDHAPEEVLGVVEPSMAACTVWKVAVNGVMAGCRPEYMPVLLAIAGIVSDPEFNIRDSGATPGWEAITMLNGPIRDELGFNYKAGHQRPGCQPNISIGRFYRLLVNNVAGFRVGSTDMSTHGQMFRAVAPENDQVCEKIGWHTLAETLGFAQGENVVSITSGRAMSEPLQTTGDRAEQHLDYLTDWLTRMVEPYECMRGYLETHVLFLSPVVAELLAAQGYSKEAVADYLKEHARVTAEYFELNCSRFNNWKPYSLKEAVENGELGPAWHESDDPRRMVPLLSPRARVIILVTGEPTRNRSLIFRENYTQAKLTSRRIELPERWDELLREARS